MCGKEDRHIETLVPRGREGTLDCVCGIRLVTVDGNDGKGVGETEDLALDEGVGCEDCAWCWEGRGTVGGHVPVMRTVEWSPDDIERAPGRDRGQRAGVSAVVAVVVATSHVIDPNHSLRHHGRVRGDALPSPF